MFVNTWLVITCGVLSVFGVIFLCLLIYCWISGCIEVAQKQKEKEEARLKRIEDKIKFLEIGKESVIDE